MIGTRQKVIIEDGDFGRCENFIKVRLIKNHEYRRGEIIEIEVEKIS